VTLDVTAVEELVSVHAAPGTMAPLESCTVPLMVLDMVCAETAEAASRRRR
jgi:hypothetical protein